MNKKTNSVDNVQINRISEKNITEKVFVSLISLSLTIVLYNASRENLDDWLSVILSSAGGIIVIGFMLEDVETRSLMELSQRLKSSICSLITSIEEKKVFNDNQLDFFDWVNSRLSDPVEIKKIISNLIANQALTHRCFIIYLLLSYNSKTEERFTYNQLKEIIYFFIKNAYYSELNQSSDISTVEKKLKEIEIGKRVDSIYFEYFEIYPSFKE